RPHHRAAYDGGAHRPKWLRKVDAAAVDERAAYARRGRGAIRRAGDDGRCAHARTAAHRLCRTRGRPVRTSHGAAERHAAWAAIGLGQAACPRPRRRTRPDGPTRLVTARSLPARTLGRPTPTRRAHAGARE